MKLSQLARRDLKNSPRESMSWFQRKVDNLRRGGDFGQTIGTMATLAANQHYQTRTVLPGRMYSFVYDPKHKDKLPVYDKFPLVLPFNMTATHFTGLNLHYLPYGARVQLLDALYESFSHKANDREYLMFSWQMISGMSRMKLAQQCVKQYIKGQVKSRFIEIPTNEWINVVQLPLEKFVYRK
jgi:hypothetical protein